MSSSTPVAPFLMAHWIRACLILVGVVKEMMWSVSTVVASPCISPLRWCTSLARASHLPASSFWRAV